MQPNEVVIHSMLIERFKKHPPTDREVQMLRDFFSAMEWDDAKEYVQNHQQMGPLESMMRGTLSPMRAYTEFQTAMFEPVALEGHISEG